ncbi:MAG: VTT domain-containing protein [bacterium]|nr:VTT domain-containing protein [bacterium]
MFQRRYIVGVVVIVAIATLFFLSPTLQETFFNITLSLQKYAISNGVMAGTIFVALSALSALLSPFSSVPFIPIAITIWGQLMTITLLLLGWVLGGICTYAIGRYAARPILERFVKPETAHRYADWIKEHATFTKVLLFRLALPAEILGYALGIVRYHFGKYIVATFIAELLFAYGATQASTALVDLNPAAFFGWTAITLGTLYAIYHLFISAKRKIHTHSH